MRRGGGRLRILAFRDDVLRVIVGGPPAKLGNWLYCGGENEKGWRIPDHREEHLWEVECTILSSVAPNLGNESNRAD